jgi:hypothetical protein
MPVIREHVRLHGFPQADRHRHHILDPAPHQDGTVLLRREESDVSHDCATCQAPLLEGCRLDRLPGLVFRCNACGAYSIP